MSVGVPPDAGVPIDKTTDKLIGFNSDTVKLATDEVPVWSIGLMAIMKKYRVRTVDLQAGFETKVEHEMKRLGLFLEPENKMKQVGYSVRHEFNGRFVSSWIAEHKAIVQCGVVPGAVPPP